MVESLYDDHGPALMAWARGRFADSRDAEEVVADTLVRGWRNHHQFDPARGSERAWMFGIARNAAVDHHRKGKRHLRSVPVGDPDDPEPRPDPDIERLVESSHVRDALAGLSRDHRDAVVAAFYRGLTTTEIAEELGIPAGTVKSRLHYALRALHAHLQEHGVLR